MIKRRVEPNILLFEYANKCLGGLKSDCPPDGGIYLNYIPHFMCLTCMRKCYDFILRLLSSGSSRAVFYLRKCYDTILRLLLSGTSRTVTRETA